MKFLITLLLSMSAVLAQDVLTSIRNRGYTAFADAVEKVGLKYAVEARSSDSVTLLVPNNAAFEAIKSVAAGLNQTQLQYVLATHIIPVGAIKSSDVKSGVVPSQNSFQNLTAVVNNGEITLNGAKVITADVSLNNAIIHVLDKVIVPEKMGSTPLVSDIVETAKSAGLTSLLGALEKASLVKTIQEASGVTVFAPTNAAFEAIKATAEKLTVEELKNILLIHVAPAVYYSKKLSDATVASLNPKEKLTVKVSGGSVTINGVSVVVADVPTTQGIVHVIEKVILPGTGNSGNNNNIPQNSASSIISALGVIVPGLMMLL